MGEYIANKPTFMIKVNSIYRKDDDWQHNWKHLFYNYQNSLLQVYKFFHFKFNRFRYPLFKSDTSSNRCKLKPEYPSPPKYTKPSILTIPTFLLQ